jgi:hypothetical protein
MKKFIAVLFVLMISNSAFALGEMGKGECIYADNGPRVEEVVADVEAVSAESTIESTQTISQ